MKHLGAAFAMVAAWALALSPAGARQRPTASGAKAAFSRPTATDGFSKRPQTRRPARVGAPVPFPPPRPGGAVAALPQTVPFPRPRPGDASQKETPAAPPAQSAPATNGSPPPADPAELAACHGRLTAAGARFEPLPVIDGNGECGASDAVRLDAVVTDDGARVALQPPATLRCAVAEVVVQWVRQDLVAVARDAGTKLTGLAVAGSYECRGRNRVPGARMSQHGTAAAIDVRALAFANGASLGFTDANAHKALRERLAGSACARFTTVLGPGSDGAHEDHVHLDAIQRRGGYRICQWDVR